MKQRVPRFGTLFSLICVIAALTAPLSGEPGFVESQGLEFRVEERPSDVPEIRIFLVQVINPGKEHKSIRGRIEFQTGEQETPARPCPVMLPVPAGTKVERQVYCRNSQANSWSFHTETIYPFLVPALPSGN